MSTVLLDTNVVSYLMKGHELARRYRRHVEGNTLAISFMTVGELYEGAFRARWGEEKIEKLKSVLRTYLVIPASPQVCWHWGQIRCERRNQPISVDDAWIAACARAHGCALVTHNPGDFSGITSLQVLTENDGQESLKPGCGSEQ